MTVTGYFRGHQCWYDEPNEAWRYVDNNAIQDDSRPCPQCNQLPTPEGYDACIGYIPKAISVCCGHGAGDGYIVWRQKRSKKIMDYFPETELTLISLPGTLRRLRTMREMKLREVSSITGLSISFLSDIERGRTRPSLDTLQKLAICYKTPLVLKLPVSPTSSSWEK